MYEKLEQWDFSKRHGHRRLSEFAEIFKSYQSKIDFKVSARGWCYLMEQSGFINKDQFDLVGELLNRCRKRGLLPVDFCAEDVGRKFDVIHDPTLETPEEHFLRFLGYADNCERYFSPDYWSEMEGFGIEVPAERYYIQMIVEKVDLVTLFKPVCERYHIPIANSKGWQSIYQRAAYARRFQDALQRGLQPVLLYCGDHDPDGLRISDTLRSNLEDLKNIYWSDGALGFNPTPQNLKIERFGLNYDFIKSNNFTWIDNLITGSGKDLADPNHKNFTLPYVQDYLRTIGERKCEANAIVVNPTSARQMCEDAITSFLGKGALSRFSDRDEIAERRVIEAKKKVKVYDIDGNPVEGWDDVSGAIRDSLL